MYANFLYIVRAGVYVFVFYTWFDLWQINVTNKNTALHTLTYISPSLTHI